MLKQTFLTALCIACLSSAALAKTEKAVPPAKPAIPDKVKIELSPQEWSAVGIWKQKADAYDQEHNNAVLKAIGEQYQAQMPKAPEAKK